MINKENVTKIMGEFGALYVNRASTNDFPAYIKGEVENWAGDRFGKEDVKKICDLCDDVLDDWEENGFMHQFGFNEYRNFSLKLLTNEGVIYFSSGAYKNKG